MQDTAKQQLAIEAILNGGKFNGTVYGKMNGNYMYFSVYVSSKEFYLGREHKDDIKGYKEQFLAMVAEASCPKVEVAELEVTKTTRMQKAHAYAKATYTKVKGSYRQQLAFAMRKENANNLTIKTNGTSYRDALAKHFSNTEDAFSVYARNESRGYGND